ARHARAVEGARRVALAEPAYEDVLAILHRDAADALHRLRGITVGALRDLLGRDRADDAGRGALRVEGVADGSALARCGGHLRLELDGRVNEADVLLERFARLEHEPRDLLGGESDAAYLDRHGAGGHVGECVAAVDARPD